VSTLKAERPKKDEKSLFYKPQISEKKCAYFINILEKAGTMS